MLPFLLTAAIACLSQGVAILDVHDAVLVAPEAIVEIDTSKLKGDPGLLAWAPDAATMYLQMVARDRKGVVTSTGHYTIAIAEKASQPPVFRAGTDLVEVDVIARDKNRTFVSDLTLDDFDLQEDGKPYPV